MTARWTRQVGGNVRVIVDEAGCIVIEQDRLRAPAFGPPVDRFTVTNVAALVDALKAAQNAAPLFPEGWGEPPVFSEAATDVMRQVFAGVFDPPGPPYTHRIVPPAEPELDDDEEPEDLDLGTCPYFARHQGLPGHDPEAVCSFGCVDEPQCITCIPPDGWPSQRESSDEGSSR